MLVGLFSVVQVSRVNVLGVGKKSELIKSFKVSKVSGLINFFSDSCSNLGKVELGATKNPRAQSLKRARERWGNTWSNTNTEALINYATGCQSLGLFESRTAVVCPFPQLRRPICYTCRNTPVCLYYKCLSTRRCSWWVKLKEKYSNSCKSAGKLSHHRSHFQFHCCKQATRVTCWVLRV